jgi:hypothetical protein
MVFTLSWIILEECTFIKIDSREPWDLAFLFEGHSRGKQVEFYSEILSLVRKRRREARSKGLKIFDKKQKIQKITVTQQGFMIHHEGDKTPEIVGPEKESRF